MTISDFKDGCHSAIFDDGPELSFRADIKNNSYKRFRHNSSGIFGGDAITVLSKGQLALLKMTAVRPYLLTDQNCLRF